MPYYPPSSSGSSIGYVLRASTNIDGANNLSDSTTYYIGTSQAGNFSTTTSRAATRLYIPKAGTIKTAYGAITISGTLSSGEDSTVAIRLNDTSNTNISTTVETSATSNAFSNNGLSIAVAAGDYIDILFITPVFATDPGGATLSCSVYIE